MNIFLFTHQLFLHLIWGNVYSYLLPIFMCVVLLLFCKILDTGPLSNIWLANILSQTVTCLLTFLMVSFETENFLMLMKSSLSIFSFMGHDFGVHLITLCLTQGHNDLFQKFYGFNSSFKVYDPFFSFFHCGKMHVKFTISTIFKCRYIHIFVQPISRTFFILQTWSSVPIKQ